MEVIMEAIKMIFNKINEENVDIHHFIQKFQNNEDISENENIGYQLLDHIKTSIKASDVQTITEYLKVFCDADDAEALVNIVDKTLIYFHHCQALRQLENDNIMLAKMLIKEIFEQHLIRFNPDFNEKYSNFQLASKQDMDNIIQSITGLTRYYVYYGFICEYILKDIKEETEISDELAQTYVDTFEAHYHELQMEYLISHLPRNK